MDAWMTTCPACGATKLTTVHLPRPQDDPAPGTRRALRCLVCDAQWADAEDWQAVHQNAEPDGDGSPDETP
ncbi:hypothetical protein [Phycicoccus sp.]|uniref:hypothetical protein n=1 Tax=Phycicoccus sp. TaxID=1902410 RepID=UPI002B8523CE|nr:hypothetical protein [Phycicoccus sp.]HMM96636.1 hypothetical protein [Phycicoccus sp.]